MIVQLTGRNRREGRTLRHLLYLRVLLVPRCLLNVFAELYLLQRRSPSVDDFISDDSETTRRRKEGKQRKSDRRDDRSDDDDRGMDNEYGSSQPRRRIENRVSVQLPDIGLPYSSDGKVCTEYLGSPWRIYFVNSIF